MSIEKLICDKCNQYISTPEEGYIEWLRNINTEEITNFHIVHNTATCLYNEQKMYHEYSSSAPGNHLQYFLGTDGLIKLLKLIEDDKVINKSEVVEIIKRVQVSGYEAARSFFDEAYSMGIIDSPYKSGFYFPYTSQIEDINNRFS